MLKRLRIQELQDEIEKLTAENKSILFSYGADEEFSINDHKEFEMNETIIRANVLEIADIDRYILDAWDYPAGRGEI